ncbi:hypothetical protein ACFQER_15140 [Halomicroarcula sp. GCM10025894]|uniref:hypothetical protein n=1 Tax=Halomicroarcula sp. GCM10025894 TaxID=3252673 RepID=UPI0036112AF5
MRVVDDDGATVLTLAEDIEFSEASENVEAESGTYSVAVFPTGADEDLDEAVFGPIDVEVRDGEVLTVFAMGFITEDEEPEFELVTADEEARRSVGVAAGDADRPRTPTIATPTPTTEGYTLVGRVGLPGGRLTGLRSGSGFPSGSSLQPPLETERAQKHPADDAVISVSVFVSLGFLPVLRA